jgi:hypothetical protein
MASHNPSNVNGTGFQASSFPNTTDQHLGSHAQPLSDQANQAPRGPILAPTRSIFEPSLFDDLELDDSQGYTTGTDLFQMDLASDGPFNGYSWPAESVPEQRDTCW